MLRLSETISTAALVALKERNSGLWLGNWWQRQELCKKKLSLYCFIIQTGLGDSEALVIIKQTVESVYIPLGKLSNRKSNENWELFQRGDGPPPP